MPNIWERSQEQIWDERAAAAYDTPGQGRFAEEIVRATVDALAGLADGGPALEFAIGTGRVAVPLAERIEVHGIELSAPMIARLRTKAGAARIPVHHGDMATTRADGEFALVYLLFNTLSNLQTQQEQVDCFANAARHLRPGGRFVVELEVPRLRVLPPGQPGAVFSFEEGYIGLDEYRPATQRLISHHIRYTDEGAARIAQGPFRYVWPAEMDLMARLAGMRLEHRWADWDGSAFSDESTGHVSVYRSPASWQ